MKHKAPTRQLFTRTDNQTAKATLRIYWNELRQEKLKLISYSLLIPGGYLLYTVLLPLLFSLIVQSVITDPSDLSWPRQLLIACAGISILALLANYYGFKLLFNHEERVQTRLTEFAMNRLMSHSYQFFANKKVGSLAGDLNGFTKAVMSLLDTVFLQAASIIVNFTASLIIIAFLAPILLVPLSLLTFLIIASSIRAYRIRAPLRSERKLLTSQLYGTVADILGNQLLVRIFAQEADESRAVTKSRQHLETLAAQEVLIIQREASYRLAILYVFQIVTVGLSVWLFSRGQVSVAALIFAITYLGRITATLFSLTNIIRGIEQALLDAAPITEILGEPIEVRDSKDAPDLKVNRGSIEFRNVRFGYHDQTGDAVFDNLNLIIDSGQRIGLAGHSGGGKTTLTKLLLRFADIQDGTILVDGQDISKVTQQSLRRAIAYVPQEPYLFHRTLRENIAYGTADTSDQHIQQACIQAHAWEFIEKLPDGLDTVVGERGVKLSGGQRQRIAIARAILKDASILVLDEATSALDSESEQPIQQALDKLMEGRTAIVIAHRLSTIQKLDKIVVLDDGNIVESGSHNQLTGAGGQYATLWQHQSGGFIEE